MQKKYLLLIIILIGCAGSGYFFYKFNDGDPFNAVIFAIGLSGISLSFLRKSDEK